MNMGRCQKCGYESADLCEYGDYDRLCRKCRKMMALEDEKDYEDERPDEREVNEDED